MPDLVEQINSEFNLRKYKYSHQIFRPEFRVETDGNEVMIQLRENALVMSAEEALKIADFIVDHCDIKTVDTLEGVYNG